MLKRTTELEALNRLLQNINQQPVDDLESAQDDAARALSTLREVSRSVQSAGWHFNSFDGVTYGPEDVTGFVELGDDVVSVDTSVYDWTPLDVAQHGSRLYDKTNQTYVFRSPITLNEVRLLDWEILPEQARDYIAARALRIYQQRALGTQSSQSMRMLIEDERMALQNFKEWTTDNGDYSIWDAPGPLSVILRDSYGIPS